MTDRFDEAAQRLQQQLITEEVMDINGDTTIETISQVLRDIHNAALAPIQQIVDEQAEDEGLWFVARTAPEGYLQQELRKLHAAIESAKTKP